MAHSEDYEYSVQTSKEIECAKHCKVEKWVKEYFLGIKKVSSLIKQEKSSEFFRIKDLCQSNIEKIGKIELLCLVLFPEYDYATVDTDSLACFLDTDATYIKVYLHKIVPNTKDYTYFKIVKENK